MNINLIYRVFFLLLADLNKHTGFIFKEKIVKCIPK